MSIYPRGAVWWCKFQIRGVLHRRSTDVPTTKPKRDAKAVETTLRAAALADAGRLAARQYRFSEACVIWLRERGKLLGEDARLMREHVLQTAALFDDDPVITTIDGAAVNAALTKRRAMPDRRRRRADDAAPRLPVSEETVRRDTIAVIRRVLNFMRDVHDVPTRHIKWGLLTTPAREGAAGREATTQEIEALFGDGLREDYADYHEFLLLAALRKTQALLKWEHWSPERQAVYIRRLKKKPGAPAEYKWHPVGPRAAALIEGQRGRHPEWIWTYVAREDGERRPITYEGLKSEWRRKRRQKAAKGLRLHDLRHHAATAIVRETGSLELARERLDHASVRTTSKFYAHVLDSDAREAAAAIERAIIVPRRAPAQGALAETGHKSGHNGPARRKKKA